PPRLSLHSTRYRHAPHRHSFPTRRSSDLNAAPRHARSTACARTLTEDSDSVRSRPPVRRLSLVVATVRAVGRERKYLGEYGETRSEEHTSELQSLRHLVCRLLLENKKRLL